MRFQMLFSSYEKRYTLFPDFCLQVSVEGALSRQAIQQALGRGLRPSGDLLPWTLAQQFVDEDFGSLTGVRTPEGDRRGLHAEVTRFRNTSGTFRVFGVASYHILSPSQESV